MDAGESRVRWRSVFSFMGLACALSWGIYAVGHLLGVKMGTGGAGVPSLLLGVFLMWGPALAAVILQTRFHREELRGPLGVSFVMNRWFLAAWLLPALVSIASVGVAMLLPGIEYTNDPMEFLQRFASVIPAEELPKAAEAIKALPIPIFWISVLQGLGAGLTLNALAAFGEELGWRGFLQRELEPLGFWRSSLLIGVLWGLWHAPIILDGHNYPAHPVLGVGMMVVFCSLWAAPMAMVRERSRSVVSVAVMHGTLNGTASASYLALSGGSDLTVGVTGLAGFVVLLLVNVGVWWLQRQSDPPSGALAVPV